MNFDSSIKKMLDSYDDKMPEIDKIRERMLQTKHLKPEETFAEKELIEKLHLK